MRKIILFLSILFLWTCGGGEGGSSPTEPTLQLPTIQNIEFTIQEDSFKTFAFMGSDPLNRALTYSISSQPQNGTIAVDAGSGTYTPNANYNGADTFYYIASNVDGLSNIGTIVATISPVDDLPSTMDVSVETDEDNDVDIAFDLTELDGDNVIFSVTNNSSNGSVSISGNSATYTPNENWNGTDQFNFQVEDASARRILNTATATIVVNSVDDVPVASNVTVEMDENRLIGRYQPVTITLDATDGDEDELTYNIQSDASNGSIQTDGTSTMIYTPNQDYNGVDTFTYNVNDGVYDSNTATVTININSMEDVPEYVGETVDWYMTIEYGIKDTFSFALPELDGDGDVISWSMENDNPRFTFNEDQSAFFALGENLLPSSSYTIGVYGTDDKGNQGPVGYTTINIIGGATGLRDVIEVDHDWENFNAGNDSFGNFDSPDDDAGVIRDPAVSYVPFASLGRTGYIIENIEGQVNQLTDVQDFDKFNYWTESSLFDIELDFSTPSLAWNLIDETVMGYVPFSAYIIDNFSDEKTQLFAGYEESDGIEGFSNDGTWTGPVYSAQAWEPIYLFWHHGSPYDPANESTYLAENDLKTSGGCGWADTNCAQLQSSNSGFEAIDINYPILTATLFTDYLGSGELPTQTGHVQWDGSTYLTASSVIFDTEVRYFDTPQGDNDDSSRIISKRRNDDYLLPQVLE